MTAGARLAAGLLAAEARPCNCDPPHMCPACRRVIRAGQREARLPDGAIWVHVSCLGGKRPA